MKVFTSGIIAAALATNAHADSMTPAVCEALMARIEIAIEMDSEVGSISAMLGQCVFNNVALTDPGGYNPTFEIRRLVIGGTKLGEFVRDLTPPTSVTIEIDNLRIVPQVNDPFFDYMLSVQSMRSGIDIDLEVNWNRTTRVVHLDRFDVDLPLDDAISATAQIANVDLSSLSALESSIGGMSLTNLDFEVTSHGLFENYVFPPLIQFMSTMGEDPQVVMEQLKTIGWELISHMPQEVFINDTKEALGSILGDLPNPGGTIVVEMTAEPGIGALRFAPIWLYGMPQSLDDVWPFLDGVEIDITYDRQPIE